MRWPKFRLRISTLLTGTAVLALVFGLIAQNLAADRRERALKMRLQQSIRNHKAQERINHLLSDRGIDILKQASGVELLRIAPPAQTTGGDVVDGVVSATGVDLEPGFALRAATVLLDHRNFAYTNADDLPDPRVGLRVKSGASSLDILIDATGSSHQDVWITIHDEAGNQVHYAGPACLNDPVLKQLFDDLLKTMSVIGRVGSARHS
jgi:hypothetical protein